MHRYRTHTCGALRESDIGKEVRLSGWCHRIRDHGGLLFIDLRDHYGVTQVVADPDSSAFKEAEKLRSEWVIRINGKVRRRPAGTENPDLPTGAVEVYISAIEVLGPAGELPMPVFGEQEYPEEIRLKYRFLDLRRERLHRNIMLRGAIIDSIRRRMKEQGFFEFQTPILTASSPEGARDYLVPSRLHPGKFYALPQAPQQFKQLVMISGFDRYFQIAPCFRDEDARADRSPGEFYQLDLEMSFVTQQDVFDAVEPVMRGVFEEFSGGKPVTQKFPLIPYAEAMVKYGSDKPDLRNPLMIADLTAEFNEPSVTFNAFKNIIKAGGVVRAIPAPGAAAQPRSFFDKLNDWARQDMGAPGLGYIVFEADGGKGPIAKFIPADVQAKIMAKAGIKAGDAVFFSAGKPDAAAKLAGAVRSKLGNELGLIDKNRFEFCWIVDFPMYEWNEEERKIDFSHNPFSMPNVDLDEFLKLDPTDREKILSIKAIQYDIVCNGVELSSGAIRNHRPDVMRKAFAIAPGIDRIVMLLAGEENLREVVLFPMNQRAEDLLMGAPSEVSPKQLRELHIRLNLPEKD
jgi:aspartyl-tRNA synthetase